MTELVTRHLASPVSAGVLPVATFGLLVWPLAQQGAPGVRCPGDHVLRWTPVGEILRP